MKLGFASHESKINNVQVLVRTNVTNTFNKSSAHQGLASHESIIKKIKVNNLYSYVRTSTYWFESIKKKDYWVMLLVQWDDNCPNILGLIYYDDTFLIIFYTMRVSI